MLIAAVIDEHDIILPIVEGTLLRIYDTETGKFEDFTNPAIGLKEGRRGATLRFTEEKGARAFVAPPNTFCELSYQAAKNEQVKFFNIEKNISFKQFQQDLASGKIAILDFLPDGEIVPSFQGLESALLRNN